MGVPDGEAGGDRPLRLLCNKCDTHFETDETMTNECPHCGLQDYQICDSALPRLNVGDHVQDRDDDSEGDTPTMIVVGLPFERADEYYTDDGETTVAEYNDSYPNDDSVVEVVFPSRTDTDLGDLKHYAYPRSRLERVGAVHSEGGSE